MAGRQQWVAEKTLCVIGCSLVLLGSVFIGPLPFLPLEPRLWLVILALFLIGLGLSAKLVSSFVDCVNHNIRVRKYPDGTTTYGLVSALFFSSCSIGAFVGPSAGGFFLEKFRYRSASLYILVTEAVMLLLFLVARLRLKPWSSDPSDSGEKSPLLASRRFSKSLVI